MCLQKTALTLSLPIMWHCVIDSQCHMKKGIKDTTLFLPQEPMHKTFSTHLIGCMQVVKLGELNTQHAEHG